MNIGHMWSFLKPHWDMGFVAGVTPVTTGGISHQLSWCETRWERCPSKPLIAMASNLKLGDFRIKQQAMASIPRPTHLCVIE